MPKLVLISFVHTIESLSFNYEQQLQFTCFNHSAKKLRNLLNIVLATQRVFIDTELRLPRFVILEKTREN